MIRILTLCTGNVCRSPLAAQLLAARLDSSIFQIESAGISPLTGDRMPDEIQRLAARMGLPDGKDHRARPLTETTLAQSDLILGMSRKHRGAAVLVQPLAVRHTFTLLEFAHVISHLNDQHLISWSEPPPDIETAVINTVVRMRGAVPRLHPEHLYDAEDPYGRSKQAFERSAKQIENAVDQIARFFRRTFDRHPTSRPERYPQT